MLILAELRARSHPRGVAQGAVHSPREGKPAEEASAQGRTATGARHAGPASRGRAQGRNRGIYIYIYIDI